MLARKSIDAVRAAITLLPMAMAIFGTPSPVGPRSAYAIVRSIEDESLPEFDHREVVRERIVLTLPLDAADERQRPSSTRFFAN